MLQTDGWGIDSGYEDALGQWHDTPEETRSTLLAAMGADPAGGGPPAQVPVLVVRPGQNTLLPGPGELSLEDGTVLRVEAALPPDLPFGYHELRLLHEDRPMRVIATPGVCDLPKALRTWGCPMRVIATPGVCDLPKALRTWGWSVQLYALRSALSWGIGDLADLRRLARWSASELNAGILLVNPLHAATPVAAQQPSPYFPSSRCYRNLLYLRIEDIPGAPEARLDLERLAVAGRVLNRERRIDRDAVFKLKREALQVLWARFGGAPAFDRYCSEEGEALVQFATFCALATHYGGGWHNWPAEYRHPHSPGVARFSTEHAEQVRFHQWVQWLLDEQLAQAATELPVMQDLPIGVDPDGADAWAWQDVFATDVTVGCPPDEYNTQGQDWGLPPFVPHKLRAARYEPFIQTIRSTLRHAGGLRIDHVMGLFAYA